MFQRCVPKLFRTKSDASPSTCKVWNLAKFNMADEKAPSAGIITRLQARKRRVIRGQDEENDAGFRFTRGSKRREEKDNQAQTKTSQVQNERLEENKDAVKEAKRRRSSFIRGRKIHSPLEVCQSERLAMVQGLCQDIPTDLSPDERLLRLFDKSLLLMCENAKDEKYVNIPNFPEKVNELVGYLQTTLKNSDFAKRATGQNNVKEKVIIPNPKAQQLEEYAKASQKTTERMIKEGEAWEEILGKYQNENESPESKVAESYGKINKDSLSSEQQEFLARVQPKENMFENLDRLKNESVLMIDKIVAVASTIKAFNGSAETYLEKNAEELIESPTPMTVCATPRHLIHAITKDSEDLR